ncbi:hypothetical protein TRFO_28741 [Tritrichomonas foetus]|uniref:Uncharacterized protein n=1 Tax=Tritrichomonas foetus TaxID=1144522 RepID=A0A1J4JY31_9EUKA|nr:hypothetical protein TRFO_28741 [Tritrichomonas foetus]|eukprot:OHT03899.1 hypothetical protein TRFO_28741 [Tritrichomonas foetus]
MLRISDLRLNDSGHCNKSKPSPILHENIVRNHNSIDIDNHQIYSGRSSNHTPNKINLQNPTQNQSQIQNQTEILASFDSKSLLQAAPLEIDQQVDILRRRSEIVLEKMLALPTNSNEKNHTHESENIGEGRKSRLSNKENQDSHFSSRNRKGSPHKSHNKSSPHNSPHNNSPNKNSPNKHSPNKHSPNKHSPNKSSPNKKNESRKHVPIPILKEKKPIVLPDSTERYEQKLLLLQNQLQRLIAENSRINSLIREYQLKIRDTKIEAEKIKDNLDTSQQQRMRLTPRTYAPKYEIKKSTS